MKKTILIFAFMGMAASLYAGPVSPEKALQVAERVLSVQSTKASGDIRIIWDGESAATKADAQAPAFYVVGRDGGGFVIVSGNDNVRPVLALSYTNRFQVEGMPCNVSAWMERIKRYSQSATEATPEVKAQWEALEQTKSDVLPVESVTQVSTLPFTVEWNQRDPANLFCPKVNGEDSKSVCGCVPLAISEIMTWFGYPESGTGTVEAYITNENTDTATRIDSHELGTTYQWTELQKLDTADEFYAEANTDLGRNLGQLVYDVGTILQVNYSSTGTGGTLDCLPQLCSFMGYSKNAVPRMSGDGYPAWKWDQMLIEQLNDHPIYYSATDFDQDMGHAYVVDGYGKYLDSDWVFHFNFGWGGYCNGWYYSDYQHTPDNDYFEYVDALFDFKPDPDNKSSYVYELSFYDLAKAYDLNGWGLSNDQRGMLFNRSNNKITVGCYAIQNSGSVVYSGSLGVFHERKDGTLGEAPVSSKEMRLGCGYIRVYEEFTVTLTGDEVLGDKYALYSKSVADDDYHPFFVVNPSCVLTEAPVYPATFIKTEASYHVNDYFYFRLTNHDITYTNAVWTITDPSKETIICNQADDRFKLTKAGKYKIKVTPRQGGETVVAVITVN